MPPRSRKALDLDQTFRAFSEGLKQSIRRPTIYGYVPHAKQLEFHSSIKKKKLYLGGNRGGKTVGGVVEDIWWLTGEHPYRETPPPPVRGRCVVVDFLEGLEKIVKPEVMKWLPPSKLIGGSWELSYSKSNRTLTLENGSFLEFMSYEQDVEKFAGTSRHFTHFDEEPPKAIFNECLARLIDVGGSYWITMTPLLGMASFIYDTLFLPGQLPDSDIDITQVEMLDNPYISEIEAENFLSTLDPDERKAREKGEFVQIGGLAFKSFKPDIHIIPGEKFDLAPLAWTQYRSMDHGLNNPTAWHYHTVSPQGILVTWDEVYDNELTVPQWAKLLVARDKLPNRRPPDITIADPAVKQRGAETGLSIQAAYAQHGIPMVLGNNDQGYGVNQMNNYFHDLKWFVTDRCPNLIKQLQRVRWATWATSKQRDQQNPKEKLHDYNNHATDGVRYLVATIMPEISVDKKNEISKKDAIAVVNRLLQPVTPQAAGNVYDLSLTRSLRAAKTHTEWTVLDEHLGGEY
jgi:Bacteriophage terminase large (ATPase) subunit and inactivated derivatives